MAEPLAGLGHNFWANDTARGKLAQALLDGGAGKSAAAFADRSFARAGQAG